MEQQEVKPSERAEKAFNSRGITGSGEGLVAAIKHRAAHVWDLLDSIPVPPGNSEAGRLVSLAKTDLEASVMWAVKAVSRG